MIKGQIGIGVTVHNRQETFNMWMEEMNKYFPIDSKIVIIDDASDEKIISNCRDWNVQTFRFEKNVGIARAKNKCLELLDDCEHIFLFDEDCWPIAYKWWLPYIRSGEPHLMYIFPDFPVSPKLNDTIIIYEDNEKIAYSHPRGCMLYFHNSCLKIVGGMDTIFGKWGYDHPDLSNRIYNAGLTSFRYMDVQGGNKLFYSADEHRQVVSTCIGKDRSLAIAKNKPIYEARRFSKDYVPYESGNNLVLTSYFANIVDPQRGEKWQPDLSLLGPLLVSLDKHNCEYVVLHDCFDNDSQQWPLVQSSISPYFQRWVSYREYLINNRADLGFVWCVDATDVEMLNNPFPAMIPGILYTGDEPDTLRSQWLRNHHKHPLLQTWMNRFSHLPLLNAGLLGGDVNTVIDFCGKMIDYYTQFTEDEKLRGKPGPGMTDMATFNYVATCHFKVENGRHINTIFKKYEKESSAWFRHK